MKSPKKPAVRKSTAKPVAPEDMSVIQPELLSISDMTEKGESISTGVGDTISKIAGALGIKECSACIKRKELLNKAYSYLEISRDVTEEEGLFIQRLNLKPGYIAEPDIKPLFALYNSLYRKNLTACRCGGVINQIMSSINRSFKHYRDDNN